MPRVPMKFPSRSLFNKYNISIFNLDYQYIYLNNIARNRILLCWARRLWRHFWYLCRQFFVPEVFHHQRRCRNRNIFEPPLSLKESAILDSPVFTSLDFATRKVISLASSPQPGGAGPCMYVPQWQGAPVISPGTGFPFCRLYVSQS
jgi:hypothetical protein